MILVNSRFSRESIMRAYGRDSKVSYLGIDTELFRPTGSPREDFVVGLGSIGFHKGIDRAISALGTIEAAKRPNLVWIGNGVDDSYQKDIEGLAASLGVNLRFMLRISDEEVVDWLSRAAALIYTSRLEPFGFAPLEANACGTPVVAIAEGGVRESIREGINGLLIDDDDPIAIGERILKLLENENLAREMSEKAKQYILDNWTWQRAVDRLESLMFVALKGKI